jgi:predicted phosphodiesterase
MRIAIFSDIHGNSIALDAVLADIQSQGGVDEYWILGDLVAIGHDPIGVMERLTKLPNAHFIRGNTDRYVVTGEHPEPHIEDVRADISKLPRMLEVARSFNWTKGAVTATGWLEWLATLPLEKRMTLPNGTRLLGIHATHNKDDGYGMMPDLSDDELWAMFEGCEADLVCVGHTHTPQDRTVNSVRIINLGSISNQFAPNVCASYVLLEADQSGYHLEHRNVEYDRDAVIEAICKARHPAADYVTRFMRGERHLPRR